MIQGITLACLASSKVSYIWSISFKLSLQENPGAATSMHETSDANNENRSTLLEIIDLDIIGQFDPEPICQFGDTPSFLGRCVIKRHLSRSLQNFKNFKLNAGVEPVYLSFIVQAKCLVMASPGVTEDLFNFHQVKYW